MRDCFAKLLSFSVIRSNLYTESTLSNSIEEDRCIEVRGDAMAASGANEASFCENERGIDTFWVVKFRQTCITANYSVI